MSEYVHLFDVLDEWYSAPEENTVVNLEKVEKLHKINEILSDSFHFETPFNEKDFKAIVEKLWQYKKKGSQLLMKTLVTAMKNEGDEVVLRNIYDDFISECDSSFYRNAAKLHFRYDFNLQI